MGAYLEHGPMTLYSVLDDTIFSLEMGSYRIRYTLNYIQGIPQGLYFLLFRLIICVCDTYYAQD